MGAMTVYEYNVDSGDDSGGDGSPGNPYQTVQGALDDITRDATNGDNIIPQVSTDDVLSSPLDLTSYGTPTENAKLLIGDPAGLVVGGISGGGSVSVFNNTSISHIWFVNMHMHNCGSAKVVSAKDYVALIGCEIDNTSGAGIDIDNWCYVSNCHVHNVGGFGIYTSTGCHVESCFVENSTNDVSYAILLDSSGGLAENNIVSIDGSSIGIYTNADRNTVRHNSVYNTGTGESIQVLAGSDFAIVHSNLIHITNASGTGIQLASGSKVIYGMNAVHASSGTAYDNSGDILVDHGNNETLITSPFVDASANDFTPIDAGNIKEGAYPAENQQGLSVRTYAWKGAIQPQASGGIPGIRGIQTGGRL